MTLANPHPTDTADRWDDIAALMSRHGLRRDVEHSFGADVAAAARTWRNGTDTTEDGTPLADDHDYDGTVDLCGLRVETILGAGGFLLATIERCDYRAPLSPRDDQDETDGDGIPMPYTGTGTAWGDEWCRFTWTDHAAALVELDRWLAAEVAAQQAAA